MKNRAQNILQKHRINLVLSDNFTESARSSTVTKMVLQQDNDPKNRPQKSPGE